MTGYTVHTGSTEKFSEGWDRIFSGKGRQKQGSKQTGGSRNKTAKTAARSRKKRKKSQ